MGYKNREIEKKFIVADSKLSFKEVCYLARYAIVDWEEQVSGRSKDLYWKSHDPVAADFIRLRYMPDGSGELTLKRADQGSNVNRIEIDVVVPEPKQTGKFLKQLFGDPLGDIHKDYFILRLDEEDTTVSVYKIKGRSHVFIEVEARTLAKVDGLAKRLSTRIKMNQEKRSLYELFFRSKK